ncbi:MAG TPA: hypothetical protein PLU94_01420 [Methanoregulaceae archaeon]|nr:hypothetical protein [Methanoregulaceae archaeon]HPM61454.1 hypothetical protein [Methanoregulaceae archaeon]
MTAMSGSKHWKLAWLSNEGEPGTKPGDSGVIARLEDRKKERKSPVPEVPPGLGAIPAAVSLHMGTR